MDDRQADTHAKQVYKWVFIVGCTGFLMSLLMVISMNLRDLKSGLFAAMLFMAAVFASPFFALSYISYRSFMKKLPFYKGADEFKNDLYLLKTSFVGTVVAWILFYGYLFITGAPGESFMVPFFAFVPLVGAGAGFFAGGIILEKMS